MQAAAGGAHRAGGAVEQACGIEPGKGGEPVSGFAPVVDVQDVGAGGAGGDGEVQLGPAGEPCADLGWVGGGVEVAVRGGRDLPA